MHVKASPSREPAPCVDAHSGNRYDPTGFFRQQYVFSFLDLSGQTCMTSSSRLLQVLLSFGLLPLAAHAQTGQGVAGTAGAATGTSGVAGPAGVSGPTLTPQAPRFGNQGARQAPTTGPTGTAPAATDPKALGPRTGTSAEEQASQELRANTVPIWVGCGGVEGDSAIRKS